jgi:hypothetical protein
VSRILVSEWRIGKLASRCERAPRGIVEAAASLLVVVDLPECRDRRSRLRSTARSRRRGSKRRGVRDPGVDLGRRPGRTTTWGSRRRDRSLVGREEDGPAIALRSVWLESRLRVW